MIPKIIHYCWFGKNDKPKAVTKCIASWKKYCPDYEIIEWNEENFDIGMNSYTKICHEQKKYAFLSDYVRLVVVYEQGGLYFDTDVEILRSFDDLLDQKAFLGFENDRYVASGLGFGAEPQSKVVLQMMQEYEPILDGKHGTAMCPELNTRALLKYGLQLTGKKQFLGEVTVLPADYFNPMSSTTGVINRTLNTYSIHHYSMSWLPKEKRLKSKVTQIFHRFFGEHCFNWLKGK